MDDYGLYARNRDRIRRIGSKLEGVVFNRYTFALFFLTASLLPIASIGVLAVSAFVFASTVNSYREEHLNDSSPYRESLWSNARQYNNQLAYLFLVMTFFSFGSTAYFSPPPSGLDELALIHAILLIIYAGAYVTNAIGIHEFRYKKEPK
jgi:hypothetical protein